MITRNTGIKRIFVLRLFLLPLMLVGHSNQDQSQNPFNKKVYLPGDIFEYIFRVRGPVPTITDGEKEFESDYFDSYEQPIFVRDRQARFINLMIKRYNYCIQSIYDDKNFSRNHAEHCKIVANNLLVMMHKVSTVSISYKEIVQQRNKFYEIEKKNKVTK